MITNEEIEKDLEWLEADAIPAAQATADRAYMEAFRPSLEAILMKESDDGETSAVIQKRNAHSHETYVQHINASRDAVFEDCRHRYMREAKQARISAWQTMSKNRDRGL